ncbi:MAG TPA: hypothetical protein VFV07_02465 [Rhizomicrobium sp.]|nr:hypothetical protein [Rhizomicrobium sp.]
MSCTRFSAAALLALAASHAAAEDIRYPSDFKPALMIHAPKGWTSERTKALLSENLSLQSPDGTMVFSISLTPTLGSVDTIAAKILHGKPTSKAQAKFAGLNAFVYRGQATNPDGLKLHLKLIVAPIDPQEAYACTLITARDDNDPDLKQAGDIVAGIKLLSK